MSATTEGAAEREARFKAIERAELKAYRDANKEHRSIVYKAWYEKNKEKIREGRLTEKHRAINRVSARKFYWKNKDKGITLGERQKARAASKKWYEKNKEGKKACMRLWRQSKSLKNGPALETGAKR